MIDNTNVMLYYSVEHCSRGDNILNEHEIKALIFNTVKDLLNQDNISKISMRQISKKCNLSIGTIYKYYGNKTEILIDITKDFWMIFLIYLKENNAQEDMLSRIDFYYESLHNYASKFRFEILSKELTSIFKEEGIKHHRNSINHFVELISKDLEFYTVINKNQYPIVSDFIANNLIMLITSQTYSYDTFKYVIKQLLTKENM